ncbi:hypothetical protein DENSPDRAFT_855261 [Dentipellis sp. KUC8613]|nr:hypothetical protein DENSPDRAFT_855261 [Dentipellis sp. KUC8613]
MQAFGSCLHGISLLPQKCCTQRRLTSIHPTQAFSVSDASSKPWTAHGLNNMLLRNRHMPLKCSLVPSSASQTGSNDFVGHRRRSVPAHEVGDADARCIKVAFGHTRGEERLWKLAGHDDADWVSQCRLERLEHSELSLRWVRPRWRRHAVARATLAWAQEAVLITALRSVAGGDDDVPSSPMFADAELAPALEPRNELAPALVLPSARRAWSRAVHADEQLAPAVDTLLPSEVSVDSVSPGALGG